MWKRNSEITMMETIRMYIYGILKDETASQFISFSIIKGVRLLVNTLFESTILQQFV